MQSAQHTKKSSGLGLTVIRALARSMSMCNSPQNGHGRNTIVVLVLRSILHPNCRQLKKAGEPAAGRQLTLRLRRATLRRGVKIPLGLAIR
jgi:hypothetical protein